MVENPTAQNRGPWFHRLLVRGFTLALAVLLFWLAGFVLSDIGNWPGPDYDALMRQRLDPRLQAEQDRLEKEIASRREAIDRDTQRQGVLSASTQEAQRTMDQLLDFQRLAIEKGVTPSADEQQALADSQRTFLDNQARYQELNRRIAQLEDEQATLQAESRALEARLTEARKPINDEYDQLWQDHKWHMAALKLGVMLPLLLVAVWLFLTLRTTLYAPLAYAFGAAVVVRIGLVMHEYFPRLYFKYILIGVATALVLRVLVYLVRSVAYPKLDWLVSQYREAYERFLCPVCEFPIRRGPLKFLFWTRRSIKSLASRLGERPSPSSADEPYTCPNCATRLYEECPACHAQRHSLLPACEHCGAVKPLGEIAARNPAANTAGTSLFR